MTIDSRPLILVSNDDGYNSKGINELIKVLHPIANVIVVAPDGPRSGASVAITSEHPLRCWKVKEEYGLEVYSCNGTPADCIKLALNAFVPRYPDMVIGGINHGDNSSVNVHYSGTMGVVIEGCLKGIPSVGFSLCNHAADADFSAVIPYVNKIVAQTLLNGLPKGVCLNVNFPDIQEFKGVKVCRQTVGDWSAEFKKCQHPKGYDYFWLTGEFQNEEPDASDSDRWALANGYVAITPTQVDMTAYSVIEEIKKWEL